jgi:hypothetical protein
VNNDFLLNSLETDTNQNKEIEADTNENIDNAYEDETMELEENNSEASDAVLQNIALFYLKLHAKYIIPDSTIQIILEECKEIHNIGKQHLKINLDSKLKNSNITEEDRSSIIEDVMNDDIILQIYDGPMRSIYSRKIYFKKHFEYIAPTEIVLGHDTNQKKHSYQYVSPLDSLKSILKNENHITFNENNTQQFKCYNDISDGSVYQNNEIFNEPSIKLILYQDAFECVNPLGSAKTKHKLVGVYYTLGNLAPHLRSKIDQMQLILLCKEKYMKEYNHTVIFSKLLEDLQVLESEGVKLSDGKTIKGAVHSIVGDNLGSHSIGGFFEKFSGQYSCRYCIISKKELLSGPSYAIGELRTKENYYDHVGDHQNGDNSFGIKSNSCFNSLTYYHVVNPGLPPCLGHDLFEGVVSVDTALFLKYFIKEKKWFDYTILNRSITSFECKDLDSKDKPCIVNANKDKLSGHAVQNWVFLRLLPLIIGKYVDVSNEVWQLLILLKNIVNIICSPSISSGQIVFLKWLIDDYLDTRRKLFPNCSLKPKHHYLSHYPWLITQFGPLIRMWTLRFESKHSYFRKISINLCNIINLEKSMAEHHQLLQSYLNFGSLFPNEISTNNCLAFSSEYFSECITNATAMFNFNESNAFYTSCLIFKGTTYKKDLYLLLNNDNNNLNIGKIIMMIVKENIVYAVTAIHHTISCPEVGLISIVKPSIAVQCFNIASILDYHPLPEYFDNGIHFLTLKHQFVNK